MSDTRVRVDALKEFTVALLQAAGLSQEAAQITVRVLVEADLKGLDSHGVSRLPVYVKNVRSGRIRVQDAISVTQSGATGVVDGGYSMGPLVATKAMGTAMALAKKFGVGAVAVRNSNHFGVASYYSQMAAHERMVGMVLSNTPAAMPPTGGKRPFFGTNPLAFSFPTSDDPIEIDLSTSVVARGKIIHAVKTGKAIPSDWAVDEAGNPTTDAVQALAGSLLPIAGAKGYGLALAIEVLCSVLTASVCGPQIGWMYDDKTEPIRMGHFLLAIDVMRFLEWTDYVQRIDQMRADIKAVEKASGVTEILLPGERRTRVAAERSQHGIPLAAATIAELQELAASLAVPELVVQVSQT